MMTTDYSTLRILIVDDQAHVRTYVRGILGGMGIEHITEANDGRAALAALRQPDRVFDLALVDLKMADLDGVETIREMARVHARCAVAILSVEDEHVIDAAGVLAKMQGLRFLGAIQKPLTSEKLEPLLLRVVGDAVPATPELPGIAPVEIREAFERHEMFFNYDPQINIRSGECESAQALIRWAHPQRGVLGLEAFQAFVDRAPEHAKRLASLVLGEAVTACGAWQQGGHAVGVSIPLSPRVFDHVTFTEEIEAIASHHRVVPAAITFELSAHHLPGRQVALIDIATRLRLKGFRLAISEFGSGHTTMDLLQDVPFSELKLDRLIVDGCVTDKKKRAVVEASLALSARLRLRSVAVGVANRDEWNLLADLGCEAAQGPFLARPASADDFEVWITRWMMSAGVRR